MDLADKLAIAKRSIDSIVTHDDEDAAVRNSILDLIEHHVDAARTEMNRNVRRRIESLTNRGVVGET